MYESHWAGLELGMSFESRVSRIEVNLEVLESRTSNLNWLQIVKSSVS